MEHSTGAYEFLELLDGIFSYSFAHHELNSTEQDRQRQRNAVCCSVKLYSFDQDLRHELSVVEKDQSVRNKADAIYHFLALLSIFILSLIL